MLLKSLNIRLGEDPGGQLIWQLRMHGMAIALVLQLGHMSMISAGSFLISKCVLPQNSVPHCVLGICQMIGGDMPEETVHYPQSNPTSSFYR